MTIDVRVPAETAWAALSDWESQDAWMFATRVRGTADGVGQELQAFTGVGRLGFEDPMVIAEWEPPHRCVVLHTGRVVRGTGGFEVNGLGAERCRVVWWERVEVPLGAVGQIGWLAARPVVRLFFDYSLRKLKRMLEANLENPRFRP